MPSTRGAPAACSASQNSLPLSGASPSPNVLVISSTYCALASDATG